MSHWWKRNGAQKHILGLFFFFFNPNACVFALDSHKMKTFYFGVSISEMACIWEKTKQVFTWMINKLLNVYIL